SLRESYRDVEMRCNTQGMCVLGVCGLSCRPVNVCVCSCVCVCVCFRAVSSHLQTCGCSIVGGSNPEKENKVNTRTHTHTLTLTLTLTHTHTHYSLATLTEES